MPNTSTLDKPTNPIWGSSGETNRRNIDNAGAMVNHMQPNYKGGKNLSLITMYITNENKFGWVRILDDNIGNNSLTHISPGVTTQNLHFIFSEQFGKNKKTISELVVSKTGEHFIKGVVLNDLHYDIQLEKGVQIDDKSMIFLCNVKEKLSFVRIEFD